MWANRSEPASPHSSLRAQAGEAGEHGSVVPAALLPLRRKQARLDVVDAGGGDAVHGGLHGGDVRLDVAGGGAGERAPGDEGDDVADDVDRRFVLRCNVVPGAQWYSWCVPYCCSPAAYKASSPAWPRN
jgi:hypothetical protein